MYKKLVIIAREPTPYMIDLFNAFYTGASYKLFVLFTTAKVWSSSHNYKEFPRQYYANVVCKGKGIWGTLYSTLNVIRYTELSNKDSFILFNGYGTIPNLTGLLLCYFFKKKFSLWADHFDTRAPKRLPFISNIIKKNVVNFVISNSKFICISGKSNIEDAVKIGCKELKMINFPYVVDKERYYKNINLDLPIVKENKIKANGRTIFFFSGRLFKRKGLDLLLKSIALKEDLKEKMFLIVEGEGTLREEYETLCKNLELQNVCNFVGFRQMSEHASLMAMSEVVVIPSIYEPWCIIVHEAMLLKKIVISSDRVGAALDRIENGINGFLFKSQNVNELSGKIEFAIKNRDNNTIIANAAFETAEKYSPSRNVICFTEKMMK